MASHRERIRRSPAASRRAPQLSQLTNRLSCLTDCPAARPSHADSQMIDSHADPSSLVKLATCAQTDLMHRKQRHHALCYPEVSAPLVKKIFCARAPLGSKRSILKPAVAPRAARESELRVLSRAEMSNRSIQSLSPTTIATSPTRAVCHFSRFGFSRAPGLTSDLVPALLQKRPSAPNQWN